VKLLYDLSVIGMAESSPENKTGVYRYTSGLLKALKRYTDVNMGYSHVDFHDSYEHSREYLKNNALSGKLCHDQAYSRPDFFPQFSTKYLTYFQRLFQLGGLSYEQSENCATFDIFHTPYCKIPSELKPYDHLKRVLTVHDLIPILFPGYFKRRNNTLPEIIQSIGTDSVICVSDSTRNDLLNYHAGIDPRKVYVSYLAADPSIFYVCKDAERFDKIKIKYSLPDNYMLSLSTFEPRKNLDHLIRCFVRFITEQHVSDMYLVLAGNQGWDSRKINLALQDAGIMRNKIITLGRVPDAELAPLYSNAQAFFYLSLYEGFGLPPLEAMQCGLPIVCSNVSSLPEVVGEAGILVDPLDENSLCDSMHKLYASKSLRDELCLRSIARAKLFSWEKCAKDHLAIYKAIIEQSA
jgi:glycosyltransferase involved in cell wall biosynthesis